jgi:hypothetical protein
MHELTNDEIELLMKAIPIIMEIKVNNLEKAVNDCRNVGQNYREIKKFRKVIKRVYKDYKDTIEGLGYLAIERGKYEERVNLLLKRYNDSIFYLEIAENNGNK